VPKDQQCSEKPNLRLLGGFQIILDGRHISLPSRKDRACLAYLALNAGQVQSRENLAALLWGNTTDDRARRNLRRCLFTIRKALGKDVAPRVIIGGRQDLEWLVEAAEVDVQRLQSLMSDPTPDSLAAAATLFRGELLEGFIVGEPAFDEWLDHERRAVIRLLESMVAGLLQYAPQHLATSVAIEAAEKLVAIDQINERAQRLLMTAYLMGGRRADAARQYRRCSDILRSELGVIPEPATELLYEKEISTFDDRGPSRSYVAPNKEWKQPRQDLEAPQISDWPSIAVLPLGTPGAEPEDKFLGQALADEVIELLYRYRWLRVIARGSSFNFRSYECDAQQVAHDLDVRYVIHGTIGKWNDRVRCMAQVMEASTGQCVWADHFDRNFDDIFLLVDELAQSVVGGLEPSIGRAERRRAMRAPPDDLSAWSCYHRALEHLYRRGEKNLSIAKQLLSRACSLEPNFSAAYAYLALARHRPLMHYAVETHERTLAEALEAADRAVDLDPYSALAHSVRGRIALRERRVEQAAPNVKHAVTMSPSYAGGHFALAWYYYLKGQSADGHSETDNAICLSPQDSELGYFYSLRARAYLREHCYAEAREWARRGLLLSNLRNTGAWPLMSTLLSALGHLGSHGEAAQVLERLERITGAPRTVQLYRNIMAPVIEEDFLEHFLDGLQRSGMPN
jgi:DNA-binding SARP family transcriptional activator/TolB-like protein/ribosomal protein S28E/S33